MTEEELLKEWEKQKPIYSAWGKFIVNYITEYLEENNIDLNKFLKIPASFRLKDDKSLVDKAFYRLDKKYIDPLNEIEDKVGVRFVVLLLPDIKTISNIIEKSDKWVCDQCKHFEEDRNREPLLFTYQSVHYILRPKNVIEFDNCIISTSFPCEVQIRTLLQHAHSELTHDAIYKSKKKIKPEVHRTVAKSMALIETTDDFFEDVTKLLNHGPLEEYHVIETLDSYYFSFTKMHPYNQKFTIIIWNEYEELIDDKLVAVIQKFCKDNSFVSNIIIERYKENAIYQQSVVLFIYWALSKRKGYFLNKWPFPKEMIEPLANDLGVSLYDE